MRIVLTGGGTGGHFYPLIAVSEKLREICNEKKIINLELFFLSPTEIDADVLLKNKITFKKTVSGKIRLYPSFQNIIDAIKMPFALIHAFFLLLSLYPDVIFSKGGHGAFPVLFSARLLFIPVIIHESDSVPGRVSIWSGKFAQRIAVSYKEAAKYFDLKKVAYTGQPIRESILSRSEATTSDTITDRKPLVLVLGGSQGSQTINDAIMTSLLQFLQKYEVIHQVGENNELAVKTLSDYLLKNSENKKNYSPRPFISGDELSQLGNRASVIISRAGSTIFEIAEWGKPSIIVPITDSHGDHQRQNAFSYARTGSALVIEEKNLTGNILFAQVERIMSDQKLYDTMVESSKKTRKNDAAKIIAEELIKISQSHD